jgi:3-phosphoshikimate 1-carboxyvinyltransferase
MGADITARGDRFTPLRVNGSRLKGFRYKLTVASAQVKSCLLLAGLLAEGETTLIEPVPSRDHTERMLLEAGAKISRSWEFSDPPTSDLPPGRITISSEIRSLQIDRIEIPADQSSAAFLIAAAVLIPGSKIKLQNVSSNWTRVGFLRILQRMGGKVTASLEGSAPPLSAVEPTTDVEVEASPLTATEVQPSEVPLAIDELPLVALLGCFAEGTTVVRGAQELRVKESDRIAGVVSGLGGLGAQIEATEDGFVVTGSSDLRGGVIDSNGDHRLAMLGVIAGLASREGVRVDGVEAIAISYPGFLDDIAALS